MSWGEAAIPISTFIARAQPSQVPSTPSSLGHESSLVPVSADEIPWLSDGDRTAPSPCLSVAGCSSSTTESCGGTPLRRSISPTHGRAGGTSDHSPLVAANASTESPQPGRDINSRQLPRGTHSENGVSRNGGDRRYPEVDGSPRSGGWSLAIDGGGGGSGRGDCGGVDDSGSNNDGPGANGADLMWTPPGSPSDLVYEREVTSADGTKRPMTKRKGVVQRHSDVMSIGMNCVVTFSDECDNGKRRLDDDELLMPRGELYNSGTAG